MSYIRGALPFLIYNPNTRDDITPDGVKQRFELSQEVPGGYEGNVQVLKREYKLDSLVSASPLISFTSTVLPGGDVEYKIVCQNAALSAALSVVQPGDVILVSGAAQAQNNTSKGHIVLSSVYNGTSITFTVEPEVALLNESAGASVTLNRRYVGPWEILEPEVDYRIFKDDQDGLYKIIGFTVVPQEKDVIYVIHRGEATYNFVPTEKSVGPAQLSENLRAFKLNIFTGNGTQTDFELTVDEPDEIVNARTLEVSVNGVLKYGTDSNLTFVGDFELLSDKKTIRFATAPAAGAKIHVRNLGFSTVSRRQTLSPSQTGALAPNSVGTQQLQNGAVTESKLATNAVSSTIIQANAVNDTKILLRNDQWLRAESGTTPGATVNLLKIDASNKAILRSAVSPLSLNVADTRTIQISTTAIFDSTSTGQVSLGTLSNKFKDAYLSGTITAGALSVSGTSTLTDVTVNGSITITGSVDGVDISDLQAQVAALAALVAQNTPAGSIKLWANETAVPTGWLLCNGASVLANSYKALFDAIGTSFGGDATKTGTVYAGSFNLPDFRGRFPLGKAASGTGSGWGTGATARAGSLDHKHTTPAHNHGLASHTHTIPPHYHAIKGRNTANNADVSFGSTLAISTSGPHNTSIDHKHPDVETTEVGHSHKISLTTTDTNGSSENDGKHSHSADFDSGRAKREDTKAETDLSHDHSASSGNNSVGHTHKVTDVRFGSNNTKVSDVRILMPGEWTIGGGAGEGPGVSASATNQAWNTGGESASHSHEIKVESGGGVWHYHTTKVSFSDDGKHSHKVSGKTAADDGATSDGNHKHKVNITFSGNTSGADDGKHKHENSDFTGAIGNVNSGTTGDGRYDGQKWVSQLISGSPSVTNTDNGGGDLNTGEANPAFQTINFIIKT